MELFSELSIILVIAAGVAGVAKLLRQPLIISYIFAGLILGPYFLDLVHSEDVFSNFARFGIALLLFIVGLGLNPKTIRDVGKTSVVVGLGQVIFTAGIGFGIAKLLGFTSVASFYVAVALTFSSTIIVLKILNDKRETQKLHGRIGIGILLVQDLIASVLLLFVAGSGEGDENALKRFAVTTGLTLIIAGLLYLTQAYVLPRFKNFLSGSQEFLFNFSLAWGFGVASLFALAGLSIEVGAFFAGVVLATQPYAQEVSSRLRPLRDFFILIFFIVLGVELDIGEIGGLIPQALLLSGFVWFGNPLIVMTLMGIMGYTKRTSFKLGLTVAQISEFSLIFILLANEVGIVDNSIVSLVTLVGLITIALSTYMMLYDNKLFDWFEKYLSLFERKEIGEKQTVSKDTEIFLFGYSKGGQEFTRTFEKLNKRYVVVDYDPEAADEMIDNQIPFVYGDMTDIGFLDEMGVEEAKVVICTVRDELTNTFLVKHVRERNARAIIIAHSENPIQAAELYEEGATYVMMPHYIGSERVSHMLRKSGLKKSDFTPARERHMRYVQKNL